MSKKIKIGYVLNGLSGVDRLAECDIVLAHSGDSINLKSELSGKSDKLTALSLLSHKVKGLLLVYADTDNFGIFHKSIITLYRGKIVAICDKTSVDVGQKPSFGFKICEADGIKCGVLVDGDVVDTDGLKSFSNLQCDIAVGIVKDDLKIKLESAVETLSYVYGIKMAALSRSCFVASDGDKVWVKRNDIGEIILDLSHRYYEIINKKRGN